MPNGRPGDHPLTDILHHHIAVYSKEIDDLIRKISRLCSTRELDQWWEEEIARLSDLDLILEKSRTRYEALAKRATNSGAQIE